MGSSGELQPNEWSPHIEITCQEQDRRGVVLISRRQSHLVTLQVPVAGADCHMLVLRFRQIGTPDLPLTSNGRHEDIPIPQFSVR